MGDLSTSGVSFLECETHYSCALPALGRLRLPDTYCCAGESGHQPHDNTAINSKGIIPPYAQYLPLALVQSALLRDCSSDSGWHRAGISRLGWGQRAHHMKSSILAASLCHVFRLRCCGW